MSAARKAGPAPDTAPIVGLEIVTFSKANGGLLSKSITATAGGGIKSDGSKCVMNAGTARRTPIVSMTAGAAHLAGLKDSEAIAPGRLADGLPASVTVTTKAKLKADLSGTAIARTRDYIDYAPGPGMLLIDFDQKGMPDSVRDKIAAAGGLLAAISGVVDLTGIGRVERASTSAGLSVNGVKQPETGGLHIYLLVADATDTERALKTLHDQLWLAGYGWMAVGAAGQALERSPVDRSVWGPERLIFEGGPRLGPGVTQDKQARTPVATEGRALDTVAEIRDVNPNERGELERRKKAERERIAPEMARVRAVWTAARVAELMLRGATKEAAERAVARLLDGGVLLPSFGLLFDDDTLGTITVGDVLADPERFVEATLADPVEGIDYGRGKAILFQRADGGLWVYSFAHGGIGYELKFDADTLRAVVMKETEVADAIRALVRGLKHAEIGPEVPGRIKAEVQSKFGYDKPGRKRDFNNIFTAIEDEERARGQNTETSERRVPDNAGLFAGMTIDELVEDLCFVVKGGWWWSLSRAVELAEKSLDNALSGLSRPALPVKQQPATFIGWLRASRNVATFSHFVRRPGQPPICETALGVGDNAVNMWRPLPPIPEAALERVRREGDAAVVPWLLLAWDICDAEPTRDEILCDWAAGVMMEPARKPGWGIILYSDPQGIGKDAWVYGLGRAVGLNNLSTINRKTLERGFNPHLEKRIVHVSDMHTTSRGSMNGMDIYNSLKQVLSNLPKAVEVNQKHTPVYDADNLSAWILSMNEGDPVVIPHEDRRWCVIEGRKKRREPQFYAPIADWLDAPGNGDLIRAWLHLRWEAMSAERRAALSSTAPWTEAKGRMIETGLPPLMAAVKDYISDDATPDLITLKDIDDKLFMLKQSEHLSRNLTLPRPETLGNWMKKFQVKQVPVGKDGEPIPARLRNGENVRVYAIRRVEIYEGLATTDIGKLYWQQAGKQRNRNY